MEIIFKIDRIIREYDTKEKNELSKLKKQLREYLQEYSEVPLNNKLTLPQAVINISDSGSKHTRNVSMIILHALGSSNIFNTSETNGKLVELFDRKIKDLYKRFDINIKSQTFKKIEKLSEIHNAFCILLDKIINIDSTINSILSSRQDIERIIRDKGLISYLSYLDFSYISNNIIRHFKYLSYYERNQEKFYESIPQLISELNDELKYCEENQSFLTIQYYSVYLRKIKSSVEEEKRLSKEKYNCKVSAKELHITLNKKYPLHIVDKNIDISLPFHVSGNGMARNVQATIVSDNDEIRLNDELLYIGNRPPGIFIIQVPIVIITSTDDIKLDVFIEWSKTGDNTIYDDVFSFTILAQDKNIDWSKLKSMYPYSLGTAHDEQFIGRKDIVRRIWNGISSPIVTSSYITGHKRVGKTSLAYAVIDHSNDENYKFIYTQFGDFTNDCAKQTLNDLGQFLLEELLQELSISQQGLYQHTDFNGSLSPLIKLANILNRTNPSQKFIIVLDEFDEMDYELYRMGSLAKAFFLNLRALSVKPNIGFILVGSEGMKHIIAAQGDKLNNFTKESLDSFDKESEWTDYQNLIRMPVNKIIYWHDDSIYRIYDETSGHPYFTKVVCAPLIEQALKLKDAEITSDEVNKHLPAIVSRLGVNVFAHFWKDGIDGNDEEKEIQALNRCRVLVAYARVKRRGERTELTTISKYIPQQRLSEDQISIVLDNFCSRKVMKEDNDEYFLQIPFFERWLINMGINSIILDKLGDELADKKKIEEDNAYITSDEVIKLVNKWPLYQGNEITTDNVRDWLQQEPSQIKQRIFLTLLNNLKFPKEKETNELLISAHDSLKKYFQGTNYITKKRSDRRQDIIVTYVDGAGKSGAYYAPMYVRGNKLSTSSNTELKSVNKKLEKAVNKSIEYSGIVIIDDFIGTGESISKNIMKFIEENISELSILNIPIRVVALYATPEGENYVLSTFSRLDYQNIDLYVCEILDNKHFAFTDNTGIWKNEDEKIAARLLCEQYGLRLSKNAALGYKNQGLLIAFSRNCPNNSLPIFHTSLNKETFKWRPLFERTIS